MNFKSVLNFFKSKHFAKRKACFSSLSKDKNVKRSSIFSIMKCVNSRNASTMDLSSEKEQNYHEDIDLRENPTASYDDALEQTNDYSFRYNELLVCKAFNEKKNGFSTKMFVLKKDGLFTLNYLNIFHEHIIYKSLCKMSSRRDFNVTFELLSKRFDFKRPTLYEYASLKLQTAVSSHFSILTLAPVLLELGKNTKVLECGSGSGTMTLFLSQHLGNTGTLHTFDLDKHKVVKAKEFFWDWKNSFDSSVICSSDKWPCNVKFGVVDFCKHNFNEKFESKKHFLSIFYSNYIFLIWSFYLNSRLL
jgi:hypothetical protein